MNEPELYITDNLPSFDSLETGVFHTLDINKENKNEIEQYVLSCAYYIIQQRINHSEKFEIQYSYNPDFRLLTDSKGISLVTFLNDCSANAFVITNINKDKLKYKEFDERCKLYLSSVVNNHIVCSMSNNFHTMLGEDKCNVFHVNILLGDNYNNQFSTEHKCDKHKFVNKEMKQIAVNRDFKIQYECFNDIVYNNTLSMDFKEIVIQKGLFELMEYSNDMSNYKMVLHDIDKLRQNDINNNNRFNSRNIIKAAFTSITCDWITKCMRETSNETRIKLHPSKTSNICDYMQFVIDKWLLFEYFKFYNVPSEMFTLHISNIALCDVMKTDEYVFKTDFVMDIAFSNIDGNCHKFKDGTRSNLSKGDCIMYAANTIDSNNCSIGTVTLLRIEFKIIPKNNTIVTTTY
jgi:hypothetical protein